MKNLLKTLESIGKAADDNLVKASSNEVSVYFGLPLEVVKIETEPPQPAFAKIGRLIAEGLNAAYATVQKEATEKDLTEEDVFTVSADGNLGVIMNGKMEIIEIGFKTAPQEEGDIESLLKNVVVAANAGYLQIQIKALELGKSLTQD